MKRLGKGLLILVALFVAGALLLRTPDTAPATMRAKYATPPSRFLAIGDGVTVHLRDEGPRDAPVIVLLHGSNADLHLWDAWTPLLTAHYRVIRFDQIGHGLTGRDPKGAYLPEDYVRSLDHVVARLGLGRFVLVGHSMGGRGCGALCAGPSR